QEGQEHTESSIAMKLKPCSGKCFKRGNWNRRVHVETRTRFGNTNWCSNMSVARNIFVLKYAITNFTLQDFHQAELPLVQQLHSRFCDERAKWFIDVKYDMREH
uniref:Uncharacterized protein n=1 Tax=Parascaris univalens TaxID=6257 RepID=A0A915A4S5_PARUN